MVPLTLVRKKIPALCTRHAAPPFTNWVYGHPAAGASTVPRFLPFEEVHTTGQKMRTLLRLWMERLGDFAPLALPPGDNPRRALNPESLVAGLESGQNRAIWPVSRLREWDSGEIHRLSDIALVKELARPAESRRFVAPLCSVTVDAADEESAAWRGLQQTTRAQTFLLRNVARAPEPRVVATESAAGPSASRSASGCASHPRWRRRSRLVRVVSGVPPAHHRRRNQTCRRAIDAASG